MYQGWTLQVTNALPRLIVLAMLSACEGKFTLDSAAVTASAKSILASNTGNSTLLGSSNGSSNAPSGPGASLVFSYPSGFASASGAIRTSASAQFSGSVIELTSGTTGQHEAGAAWYIAQQNITSFTTDFTFQLSPTAFGITFCVQNSNSATNPLAFGASASADTNLLGFGAYILTGQYPILNGIAVKFDIGANGTGLYINGGPAGALIPQNSINPSMLNFGSGDILAAHIVYDGTVLTLTVRDTVTNAQFRTSWPIDIPTITGSNTAWVGFTAGTIPAVTQNLLSWSFSEGYNPVLPAPSFSVAEGSYPSAQTVSLSTSAGATIYYTTNGQQPTSSSSKYTGPISVSSSEVVQAITVETGYTDSSVAVANYQIAEAGTPLINFPNGFASASNLVTVNGAAQYSGAALQLTDTNNFNEAATAWYVVPVNVQSFATHFTIQLTSPNANGMTFAIQNQNPASSDGSSLYVSGGPNAIANDGTGLGYSGSTGATGGQIAGLLSSIAVKFNLYPSVSTTGLYTNGADLTTSDIDMTGSGFSLHSGNPINVTLTYDGTTLSLTATDTVTSKSFSHSWAINIPATVGGDTAYVGFTAATGGQNALQKVLSWTYSSRPNHAIGLSPSPPSRPLHQPVISTQAARRTVSAGHRDST